MLSLIILLFLPSMVIFASGVQEPEFAEIDELLKQKDYNTALSKLNEYLLQNPDDFDRVQKRVEKVFTARSGYATLADELINVIINEPENDEKKLAMIETLENLEKNSSVTTRKFIVQTRNAAEFTFNRSKFEELMVKGSNETKKGDYIASLKTNQEGFKLYHATFSEQGYEQSLLDETEAALLRIKDSIDKFELIADEMNELFKSFNFSLKQQDIESSLANFLLLKAFAEKYSEIRNIIAEAGWFFQNSFSSLQKQYPDLTEASFLAFAYRFVLGRASDPDSGMLGALDTQWMSLLVQSENTYTECMKLLFTNSIPGIEKLLTNTAASNKNATDMQNLLTMLNLGTGINELSLLIKSSTGTYPKENDSILNKNITDGIKLVENCNKQNARIVDYFNIVKVINGINIPNNFASLLSSNDTTYTDSLIQIISDLRNTYTNSKILEEQLRMLSKKDYLWSGTLKALEQICKDTALQAEENILERWKQLSNFTVNGSENILNNYKTVYNDSYTMLNEALDSSVPSYPTELIPIINASLATIDSDMDALKKTQLIFRDAPESIQGEQKKVITYVEEMQKIKSSSRNLISKAQERIILAERSRSEAELRYNQAVANLNMSNFQQARDNLQRSRTRYNDSLLYQESEKIRKTSDELLQKLGDDIIRAENELVVREVRKLKTDAKNAYYLGDFERAENLLSQAKTRWATTNVDEDNEIISLMSLVGTALSMKTGRVIPPSAPLYPEMSQILNIANQFYDKGKVLIQEGNKKEAEEMLNKAKQKLRELQLVYPLNQEASLLTLRIDQLIDPVSFNTYFIQKVKTAQTEYLDPNKRQTVYTDLLDLYEINPKYTGLKDFIYQVEIKLGIRVLPPDKTAQVKAKTLTLEAQKLYDSGSRNEITLNAALSKINEALAKNPDNTEAQILKDRINTALGGSGTAVLPAEAEALYQRAVQELQKGNTLQASAIVTQLMQNVQYRKSSKILDLKKKVESLL